MKNTIRKYMNYLTQDIVFSIAMILAIFSMLFVPPSKAYLGYIKPMALVVMFSLMIVVAGLKEAKLFTKIAHYMTSKFKSTRNIARAIIFSSFFLGMLITNDAVLLTLIPFTIIVNKQIKQEKYTVLVVILQTMAANIGASLTPMGSPQNIYLYTYFHLGFFEFILAMLPVVLTGFILIWVITTLFLPKDAVSPILEPLEFQKKWLPVFALIFIVTVLTVLNIIPIYVALANTLFWTVIFFPRLLKKVDYYLLLTFVMFFIFVGNLTQWNELHILFGNFLSNSGRVYLVSIGVTQFLSDVPTSVLLSPFVDPSHALFLLQGVNVGAIGSLISSLATLIAFKFIINAYPHQKKTFILTTTAIGFSLIAIISIVILLIHIL